jgi:hypothetical protein
MPFSPKSLPERTQPFVKWLFRFKPRWLEFASIVRNQEKDVYSLFVDVPSPTSIDERKLRISSKADDIFIKFYNWETSSSLLSLEKFDMFEVLLEKITSDKFVSCVVRQNSKIVFSTLYDTSRDIKNLKQNIQSTFGAVQIEFVSFTGSADQELAQIDWKILDFNIV